MNKFHPLGRTAILAVQAARSAVRIAFSIAVLFTLMPSSWAALTKIDIAPPNRTGGQPAPGTYTTGAGTTFTITSDGTGFYPNMALNPTWDGAQWVQPDTNATGDVLTFVYEPVTGDFDKRVQVTSITNINPATTNDAWTRGGIMFRTATNHYKTSFQILAGNPAGINAVVVAGRALDGQNYTEWDRRLGGVTNVVPNQWLRVRRVGDYFTWYVGTNGTDWTLVCQRYQILPADLILGPFASAGVYDGAAANAVVNFANYGNTPVSDGVVPALVSAGTLDKAVVGVRFSEPVTKATATVLANYSITQGGGAQPVVVTAAKMGIGADAVYLTVTGLTNNIFVVKVNGGVQDVAGNTIAPNTQVLARALNWNHADIGYFSDTTARPKPGDDPYNIGQAVMVSSDENPEIEIIGGGSNAWNPGDFIHYIWRTEPLSGNFDVTIAVTRNDHCTQSGGGGSGGWANSGIMLRKYPYVPGDNPNPTKLTNYLATQSAMIANTTYEEADGPGRASIALWRYHDHEGYSNGGIIGWGAVIGGIKGYYSDLRATTAAGAVDPLSSPVSARYLRIKREGTVYTMYVSFNRTDWALTDGPRNLPDLPDQLLLGFSTMNDTGAGTPPYGGYQGMGHQMDMSDPLNPANTGNTSGGIPILGIVQNDSHYSVQRIKVFPNGVSDPLPVALTPVDIRPTGGSSALSGAWVSTGTFSFDMNGGGTGVRRDTRDPSIGGDELTFAYEVLTGDFDKQVAITRLTNGYYDSLGAPIDTNITPLTAPFPVDVWARAGLMVRNDTNAYGQCLKLLAANPAGANQVAAWGRGIDAQNYTDWNRRLGGVSNNLPNQYLRIKRVGNSFSFYVSKDGVVWGLMAQRYQEMSNSVLFGPFCAASLNPTDAGANPDALHSRALASFTAYRSVSVGDVAAPQVISVGTLNKTNIGVKFSEQVNSATATTLANYSVWQGTNQVTITGAKMGIGGDAVYLTVSGLTNNTFSVTVTNVTDSYGNKLVANTTNVLGKVSSSWTFSDIGYIQNPSPRVPTTGDDPYRIGQVVATSSDDAPEVEILGGGGQIWNTGDYMTYTYNTTPLSGDFDVVTKLSRNETPGNHDGFPDSGLFLRASLYNAGEEYTVEGTKVVHVANVTYAENTQNRGGIPLWRTDPHGGYGNGNAGFGWTTVINGLKGYYPDVRVTDAAGTIDPESSPLTARWLRIKRVGNDFTFYVSWNGLNWSAPLDPPATLALPSSLLLGFASTQNNSPGAAPGGARAGNGHSLDLSDPLYSVNGTFANEGNYAVQRVRLYSNTAQIGTVNAVLLPTGQVSVTYAGTLVSSTSLNGPWNVVPKQSSPWVISPTGARTFYRVLP
jgi:hypothetical protein